jgi:hypothetical protein
MGAARTEPLGFIRGKTYSTISGNPHVSCFLLTLRPLLTSYFYLLDWAPVVFYRQLAT